MTSPIQSYSPTSASTTFLCFKSGGYTSPTSPTFWSNSASTIFHCYTSPSSYLYLIPFTTLLSSLVA